MHISAESVCSLPPGTEENIQFHNIKLTYYSNRGSVFCQSSFNFHCCESERQSTVNPIVKNTSFIKVPFPSLIVNRYCMWGGPPVVFIAIYVGWLSREQGPCDRGPRGSSLKGPRGSSLKGPGAGPRWPEWDISMDMFENCYNVS